MDTKNKLRFFRRSRAAQQNTEHVGKEAVVQTFYEGPRLDDDSKNINWVEWAPPSLPAPKKKKFEGAAIQVYKRVGDHKNAGMSDTQDFFYPDIIRLQSPFIREALEETFKKHGLSYGSDGRADSRGRHQALFHAREKIAEVAKTADDEFTRNHCEVLCEVIENNLSVCLDGYERYDKDQTISYDSLWTLFPEGSIFATRLTGKRVWAFRVQSVLYIQGLFTVNCQFLGFDGSQYGYLDWKISLPRFGGRVHVSELKPYPFIDLTRNPTIKNTLLERGRDLLNYQVPRYLAHAPAKEMKHDGDKLRPWLVGDADEERIMIDRFLHKKIFKGPPLKPLPGYSNSEIRNREHDASVSKDDSEKHQSEPTRPTEEDIEQNRQIVSDDEANLLLMNPNLMGFSLRESKWKTYQVEDLQPLELESTAFEQLVFDEKKKDLVQVLTESYLESNSKFDDLIAGKGQSLLILLSGEPGTGKTLMAESLADRLKRPLLRIGSSEGDFDNMSQFGVQFKQHTKLASEWGGLVLFDEARFLVQNRKEGNDNFISAFIRHIEYFKGIVILTTNVTELIDAAIRSRVQIHLTFPALTKRMRARVWNNFRRRLPEEINTLSSSDVDKLSKWQLNGREIKNAINMAVAWCQKKNLALSVDTLEDLITLISPFANKELVEGLVNGDHKVNGLKASASKELNDSLLEF